MAAWAERQARPDEEEAARAAGQEVAVPRERLDVEVAARLAPAARLAEAWAAAPPDVEVAALLAQAAEAATAARERAVARVERRARPCCA